MSRERKVALTFWATLLLALPAVLLIGNGTMECGEMDRGCSTGGPMPNAALAWLTLAVLITIYGLFMRKIWSSREPD